MPSSISEWAGLALGVLGIVLGISFHLWSKKSCTPRYSIRSNQIISGEKIGPHDLSVQIGGKPVTNLVISRFAFWNAGGVAIEENNCGHSPHVIIGSTHACKILDVALLTTIKAERNLAIVYDNQLRPIGINFAFLRPREGFVLTLAHEGTADDRPLVQCELKNGDDLKCVSVDNAMASYLSRSGHGLKRRQLMFAAAFFGTALVAVGCLGLYRLLFSPRSETFALTSAALLTMGAFYFFVAYLLRARMPESLIEAYSR